MGKRENIGYIRWPGTEHASNREDQYGTWVYAFWLAEYTEPVEAGLEIVPDTEAAASTEKLLRDPFIHCEGPDYTIALPQPHNALGGSLVYPATRRLEYTEPLDPDAIHRGNYLRYTMDAGAPVLAAVCLGSVPFVYTLGVAGWLATPKDLTRKGRKLVDAISELYGGRPAHLVTYVDAS